VDDPIIREAKADVEDTIGQELGEQVDAIGLAEDIVENLIKQGFIIGRPYGDQELFDGDIVMVRVKTRA
jgi:hypothetical protein